MRPRWRKARFAEVQRLTAISDCDDDDGPHHFTVTLLTDDPEAVSDYVAHRPRALAPFAVGWPRRSVERPLPAVAVSIADNIATVTLEPDTAEMSEETKAAIVAADRQRIFIDARGLVPADYPQETLAFLFSKATLVLAMGLDCSKPGAEEDIEAANAIFDARAEDSSWVVRLFTNSREWGDFIDKHRPVGDYLLAWPTYDAESAAG